MVIVCLMFNWVVIIWEWKIIFGNVVYIGKIGLFFNVNLFVFGLLIDFKGNFYV